MNYIECGKFRQREGQRNQQAPYEYAVEDEGEHGLSAGAHDEIAAMADGNKGHDAAADADEAGCQAMHGRRGIVHEGNCAGAGEECDPDADADHQGEGHQLICMILGLGGFVCAQGLADDDRCGGAHGHEGYAEKIVYGAGNIGGGHHVQAAHGVNLVEHGHAHGPEQFIYQQGRALDGDIAHDGTGDAQRAEKTGGEGMFLCVGMGIDQNNHQLHIAGEDGGICRAGHAQAGEAELAVNQQVIEHQVDQYGDDACIHGQRGFTGFAQGTCIALCNGEGNQSQQHDAQILHGKIQGTLHAHRVGSIGEVQGNQLRTGGEEQDDGGNAYCDGQNELIARGCAHALHIACTVVLGGKDARTGYCSEYGQVEYEDQLVGNGNAGHLVRADAADHQIIQQIYKIRNGVLNNDRYHNGHNHGIKLAASDQLAKRGRHMRCTSV